MAVFLELSVTAATQELFNKLDDRVGEAIMRAGRPPAGLLAHAVYSVGDGFVVADVWRTEAEGQAYLSEVLPPLVDEVGLSLRGVRARPVWSFARP